MTNERFPPLPEGYDVALDAIDDWAETAERWVKKLSAKEEENQSFLVHSLYVSCFHRNRIFAAFYEDLTDRLRGGRKIKYKLSDPAMWVLLVAASGVIGNLAYDAIKEIVNRIRNPEDTPSLEETVTIEFYERNRQELHGSETPLASVDTEFESTLKVRYVRTTRK